MAKWRRRAGQGQKERGNGHKSARLDQPHRRNGQSQDE